MKALVTGSAGFIGSHLVDELMGLDWDVAGIDICDEVAVSWDHVMARLGSWLWRGDVCDHVCVRSMIRKFTPDIVFHLAAQSHVDASLANPGATLHTNAVGTQVVAEMCSQAGVPMVYCSTDEVYGDVFGTQWENFGCDEEVRLNPSSPYSAGKAAGDMVVLAMGRSMSLKATITRGCNAYGGRQYPEKLVPIACQLLQRGKRVPLHGGGRQIRQWIAVEDFVLQLRAAGEHLLGWEGGTPIWNLAGPSRLSVVELVEEIALQCGMEPSEGWFIAQQRPGQDRSYHVSGEKVKEHLGIVAQRQILQDVGYLVRSYPADGGVKLAHV